jgi:prepilin-type N-terminal cleavage/methylation domain-containing protein
MVNKHRRGFTLVELLTVMTIIGLLAGISTVNLASSRISARNARRLADMDSIRTALELYYDDYGGYPSDQTADPGGLVLGKGNATMLSSVGFSSVISGTPYLESVPSNPSGGGADYLYYSLNSDGTHCDLSNCQSFKIEFVLEASINGIPAGAYLAGPIQNIPAPPDEAAKILARSSSSPTDRFTTEVLPILDSTAAAINKVRTDPTVDAVSGNVVAPISTAAAVVSAASGISSAGAAGVAVQSAVQTAVSTAATAASATGALGQIGALFFLLLTQPFLLLSKRKDYAWGVVYDSQKKMPVDLAIVRLINDNTKRVVQTRVTDKAGRIFFFVGKGTYRLEALKPGFVFPSAALAGEHEDGNYANLYFGQKFSVSGSGMVVNPSVPLDPAGTDFSDRDFIKRVVRNNLRYSVSLIGLALTLFAFAITPTLMVGGLFVLNLVLFLIFRRLLRPKQPAEWGTIKDEKTGKPLGHAVVRLFSAPYNKLLETRVTDKAGRYNFVVGPNVFYLTATRPGYWKTQSFSLDLRGSRKPEIIAAPVRLRPVTEPAAEDVLYGEGGKQ